jgi:hypothetical protein
VTEDVQTAQTVIKANEEIKPEIAEDVEIVSATASEPSAKQTKGRTRGRSKAKAVEPVVENVKSEAPVEDVEIKEDKPKKTRRPNRGASKRTRKTTKKNDEE